MHTQQAVTAAAPIYWTTQADAAFFDGIANNVDFPQDEGAQIVIGTHAGRIEDLARAQGADHVSRKIVEQYFGEVR